MPSPAPNLKQLAVLDWLRRFPRVLLDDRGRWTHGWESDAARLHMMSIVTVLGGSIDPAEDERDGWGTFEFTPHCGSATMKAMQSRGWLETVAAPYRHSCFSLSAAGLETLKRFCFRLKGYTPRAEGDRIRRPIKASPGLLKRYGGPEQARSHMGFHRRQAAYHTKIADRLEQSLGLYDGSPEQRRDEWTERGRRLRR